VELALAVVVARLVKTVGSVQVAVIDLMTSLTERTEVGLVAKAQPLALPL
jgi:hypothetical protein